MLVWVDSRHMARGVALTLRVIGGRSAPFVTSPERREKLAEEVKDGWHWWKEAEWLMNLRLQHLSDNTSNTSTDRLSWPNTKTSPHFIDRLIFFSTDVIFSDPAASRSRTLDWVQTAHHQHHQHQWEHTDPVQWSTDRDAGHRPQTRPSRIPTDPDSEQQNTLQRETEWQGEKGGRKQGYVRARASQTKIRYRCARASVGVSERDGDRDRQKKWASHSPSSPTGGRASAALTGPQTEPRTAAMAKSSSPDYVRCSSVCAEQASLQGRWIPRRTAALSPPWMVGWQPPDARARTYTCTGWMDGQQPWGYLPAKTQDGHKMPRACPTTEGGWGVSWCVRRGRWTGLRCKK